MPTTETRIDEATTLRVERSAFAVTIHAETAVHAPAAELWQALAAVDEWADWNPFVTRFDGRLELGASVALTMQLPDRKAQAIRPRIVGLEPGRSFEWLGRVGLPGLLDGRHSFSVTAVDPQTSRLVQHERLSGVLVPAFAGMLTGGAPTAFVALNQALASRVATRA